MQKRLDTWRKEARVHRNFSRASTARSSIAFDGRSNEALATHAVSVLDHAFQRIAGQLGAYPPNRILVTLYTERQFRDVTHGPGSLMTSAIMSARLDVLDDPAVVDLLQIESPLAGRCLGSTTPDFRDIACTPRAPGGSANAFDVDVAAVEGNVLLPQPREGTIQRARVDGRPNAPGRRRVERIERTAIPRQDAANLVPFVRGGQRCWRRAGAIRNRPRGNWGGAGSGARTT